jgi:hypothetical protein
MSMSMGCSRSKLLGFLHFQNCTAFVLAALGAGAMGQLLLVAVGAFGDTRGREEIMSTAIGGAARRVAPFRIRHGAIPFGVVASLGSRKRPCPFLRKPNTFNL